jgi:D-3-phosphoglycerate dehydrogenase
MVAAHAGAVGLELTAPLPLVIDLLRWVASQRRTYRETMEAWRTSCPRLPVWEDAYESGFLEVIREHDRAELTVAITSKGLAFLDGTTR